MNTAEPKAEVLGITDYLSLRSYSQVRESWERGRLPYVQFLFPNIEFRLSPPTRRHKGVNLHLLVNPEDPDHIVKMERELAALRFEYNERRFSCDEAGIRAFGSAFDPTIRDPEAAYVAGVNQFKIEFNEFRHWYRRADIWLRENTLVAVSNKEQDGVSGLSMEHGFGAVKDEMLRFSDLVLSGNPADRKYFLGLSADSAEELDRRCNGRMACLHGSDAHCLDEVLAPALDRRCWLKADPTFEGLQQVLFEPGERVVVASDHPARAREVSLESVRVDAPWFQADPIPLNAGLVSIIGPRGSGKTALADLIAFGADSYEPGPASFLTKALPVAADARVELAWRERGAPEVRTVGADSVDMPGVRYLSQHFVEQLCSDDGASDRLIEEIESVVFDALDVTDRSGASSFAELRGALTESSRDRIAELRARIAESSEQIAKEHELQGAAIGKKRRLEALKLEIEQIQRSLASLVVEGQREKAEKLEKLQEESGKLEEEIAALKVNIRRLVELERDLDLQGQANADEFERLKRELLELGVAEGDVAAFQVGFGGNYKTVLAARRAALAEEVKLLADGPEEAEAEARPLARVRAEIDAIQKEIGGDQEKAKKLVSLQAKLKEKNQERQRLEVEIENADGAVARREEAGKTRLARYLQVFEELERQRNALAELYRPLQDDLAAGPAERQSLSFHVRQLVDVRSWAQRGEELLDLRRKTEFREPGSLEEKARELLENAWRAGDLERIREGMTDLVEIFKDAKAYLKPTTTLSEFATWLFSTDHIEITYGIRYEGKEIQQLSPGTKGIVLLILYLCLDTADDSPLIIDQPEENLDPKSIHEVLTPYFREARRRRQVVLVTHNANLVVNTDSDQVIVARAEPSVRGGLPTFSYRSGALENRAVMAQVCEILEGGRGAFLARAQRYGLKLAPGPVTTPASGS